MDCWNILGIERTTDTRLIKKAYASKVKECHSEDNPQEWMQLHDAYKAALNYAKSVNKNHMNVISEKAKEVYVEQQKEPFEKPQGESSGKIQDESQEKSSGEQHEKLYEKLYEKAYEKAYEELHEKPSQTTQDQDIDEIFDRINNNYEEMHTQDNVAHDAPLWNKEILTAGTHTHKNKSRSRKFLISIAILFLLAVAARFLTSAHSQYSDRALKSKCATYLNDKYNTDEYDSLSFSVSQLGSSHTYQTGKSYGKNKNEYGYSFKCSKHDNVVVYALFDTNNELIFFDNIEYDRIKSDIKGEVASAAGVSDSEIKMMMSVGSKDIFDNTSYDMVFHTKYSDDKYTNNRADFWKDEKNTRSGLNENGIKIYLRDGYCAFLECYCKDKDTQTVEQHIEKLLQGKSTENDNLKNLAEHMENDYNLDVQIAQTPVDYYDSMQGLYDQETISIGQHGEKNFNPLQKIFLVNSYGSLNAAAVLQSTSQQNAFAENDNSTVSTLADGIYCISDKQNADTASARQGKVNTYSGNSVDALQLQGLSGNEVYIVIDAEKLGLKEVSQIGYSGTMSGIADVFEKFDKRMYLMHSTSDVMAYKSGKYIAIYIGKAGMVNMLMFN